MTIKFDKILTNKEEMMNIDRTNPYNVAALLVHTICNYDVNNTNNLSFIFFFGLFLKVFPFL